MQCPKCKSEDVVKLSVIHAAGLSDINTRSRGHAVAVGDAGLLLGFGNSTGTGTSQTQLSKLAAPPRKKRYRYVIGVWLIGLIMAGPLIDAFNAYAVNPDAALRREFLIFTYVFSALVAFFLAALWIFNHLILPGRRDLWNRSFMCRCCGLIFQCASPVLGGHPNRP